MTLKERLREDLTHAMRQKDAVRKRTLRMALTEIKLLEVDKGEELNDAEVDAVLQKEAKKRREMLDELTRVDRPDLEAAEQAELAVLVEYLPKQFGRDEIAELARQVIAEVGAEGPGQMGQVMRALMPRVKGQADGKLVGQVVRELLSG